MDWASDCQSAIHPPYLADECVRVFLGGCAGAAGIFEGCLKYASGNNHADCGNGYRVYSGQACVGFDELFEIIKRYKGDFQT